MRHSRSRRLADFNEFKTFTTLPILIDGGGTILGGSAVGAKKVRPPLALGLFGHWGTGKSFFMRRMQERIDVLEEVSRKAGGDSPFCERFLQVQFNRALMLTCQTTV